MISTQIQTQQQTFVGKEIKLQGILQQIDKKEDTVVIRRRVERKSILEMRFDRLVNAMRIRSGGII